MLFLIPASLFIKIYWDHTDPPLCDIFSPLVTLILAVTFYQHNLIAVALIVDSVADYWMDKKKMQRSLTLFTMGHLIKQIAFINSDNIILICGGWLSILVNFFVWLQLNRANQPILGYMSVVLWTWVFISLAIQRLSLSQLVFVLADAIIGYELIISRIPYRRLRVLLVPALYWLAEYLLILEYQNYLVGA